MTDGDRALIRVSAALASRDRKALTGAFSHARSVAKDSEVQEVLLQSYLFLGFPVAFEGMAARRELIGPGPTGPATCALNIGALPSDVDTALAEARRFLDDERLSVAAGLWKKVRGSFAA